MNLSKINVPIFGDTEYRGKCPLENAEQITFFSRLRRGHPATWGKIGIHVKNEGKRNAKQVSRDKVSGMTTGACDIIVGGFYCELKRRDHTKSTISDDQIEYLDAASKAGMFACVALGVDAAWEAFHVYINSL